MQDNTLNFGKCVKVALAKKELSVNWLGNAIGVSRTRASNIVNSPRASTDLVARIAAALEMKPSALIKLGEEDGQ